MAAMMRPHTLGTFLTQGVFDQLGLLAGICRAPWLRPRALKRGRLAGGDGNARPALGRGPRPRRAGQLPAGLRLSRARRGGGVEHGVAGEPGSPGAAHRALPDDVRRALTGRGRPPGDGCPHRAAADLLASLPAFKRPSARLLLKLTNVYWPLRETGKATLLHGIDVGRAAARRLGELMVAEGSLEDPSDSAYLTVASLSPTARPTGAGGGLPARPA